MGRWVIAAACCGINFLILGIARMAPLLFVASMERFEIDRARASFPYVLCYILRVLSGPFIGIAGKRYGLKPTTIFGGVLSFIGIGGCYFAEDMVTITILWGCVYGFGFGFGTALLPAVIDRTFDSQSKTKANGIAYAGSSLGGIVLPPILQACLIEYGLSGSFLIAAALILHVIPASMLLDMTHDPQKTEVNKSKTKGSSDGNHSNNGKEPSKDSNCMQLENVGNSEDPPVKGRDNLTFVGSADYLCSEQRNGAEVKQHHPELPKQRTMNVAFNASVAKSDGTPGAPRLIHFSVLNDNKDDSSSEPCSIAKEKAERNVATGSFISSLRIFLDPTFLVMSITQSAYGFVCMIVWTIIVDLARDKGVAQQYQIYCMMLLPLTDMVGRVGLGWLTDGGHVTKTKFCVVSFLLLGLLSLLFIWVFDFVLIILTIGLFGFTSGGLMAVFPVVVCEFIVSEYKIMALTSRMILLAPMTFTVSPLIGFFREQQGSYEGIYYISGGVSFICCAMSASIPKLSERSREKYEKQRALK